MKDSFLKYRKGVKKGHKSINIKQPNEYNIIIRYLLNDFFRYLYCKIFLYNDLVNKNKELIIENEKLNKEKEALLYKK